MSSAALELQRAVILRLSTSVSLTAQLGGTKIYDHPASGVRLPFITIGRTTSYDWSTASEEGREHFLTVHIWSRAGGRIETHEIMEKVRLQLEGLEAYILNHRLVLLLLEGEDVRFDIAENGYHGVLNYRALTEPLS